MKFLTDQDVYAATVRFILGQGHDAVTASQLGLSKAVDLTLLQTAQQMGRIFVTRDRDFGSLVFVQGNVTGVIYLRVEPSTIAAVQLELEHVLVAHTEQELMESFTVIEPGRHRVRKLPANPSP